MLTIIGLGPGPIADLSLRAWRKLQESQTLYLRTSRHPCVPQLPPHLRCISFDAAYEAHDRFDDVYRAITEALLERARAGDDLIYAVPGDPMIGEATVSRLLAAASDESLDIEIISGISFIEPCLALIGLDALDGLQILDALDVAPRYHPPINPAQPALIAQVYSRGAASDLKLTLMNQYPADFGVKLLHMAGGERASAEELPLFEIDRSDRIDVMTTLYIPPLGSLSSFAKFQEIIAHLRSEQGCPWDREQTHQSLRPFLIEETYEALEAMDREDPAALAEELGDVLLQVVLHAQIATDEGDFQMADILRRVNDKMIRRHPHVYGDVNVAGDARQVTANWEDIKRAEKARSGHARESLLDGVPTAAPALLVAYRYSQRASKVGFDWQHVQGVEDKAREEFAEIFAASSGTERAHEIGDLIFVLVNWLRWLGVEDPESLMREINAKFYRRFRHVEARAQRAGLALSSLSLDEMETWWQEAKRQDPP